MYSSIDIREGICLWGRMFVERTITEIKAIDDESTAGVEDGGLEWVALFQIESERLEIGHVDKQNWITKPKEEEQEH